VQSTGEVTLVLGAILVFGSLVYNIHRALLFPPFFRAIGLITIFPKIPDGNRFIQFCHFWWWWRPSKAEIDLDRWRWKRLAKHRDRWDVWAAHAHFLYCAAWATLLAFIVGLCKWGWPGCRAWLILAAVFLLIAGMVNNYRLLYSMNAERESERGETKMPGEGPVTLS
jgi:hypothetical protein